MWGNVPAVMISVVGPVGVLPQLSHPTYLAMMIGFKLRAWVKNRSRSRYRGGCFASERAPAHRATLCSGRYLKLGVDRSILMSVRYR